MNQPIFRSNLTIPYSFNNVTPSDMSIKDSYTFRNTQNQEIMIGTDMLNMDKGIPLFVDKVFSRHIETGPAYAPCLINAFDKLWMYYGQDARIKLWDFTDNSPYSVSIEGFNDKEIIDPEVVKIGDMFLLFFCYVTREGGRGNELYVAWSVNGWQFYKAQELVVAEHNVEEAIRIGPDSMVYWSVGDSDEGSVIKRGWLNFNDGVFTITEDLTYSVSAVDNLTCTHPDFTLGGRLRVTGRSIETGLFHIMDMV